MVQIRRFQNGKTTAFIAVLAIGASATLSMFSPAGISAAPGRSSRGPAPTGTAPTGTAPTGNAPTGNAGTTGKPESGDRPAPQGTPRPGATPRASATPGVNGTPRPTPQPRSTPASRPTPPPRPTPVAGERDIALLEGALERTLTDAEKSAISAAATKRDAAIKSILRDFENEVAAIFDLTATQLQSKLQTCRPGPKDDLASSLATALGRALTDDEMTTLNAMIVARDTALGEAMATFHESVAAALEISPADLDAKIRAYLRARRHN